MLIRSLAGVVGAAVVLLLAVSDAMGQTTCSSKTTTEGNGNFSVSVTQVVTDQGRRQYRYAITSPTGKNPNKLFIYAHSSLANSLTTSHNGTFVAHHNGTGIFGGLADVWKVQHHEGGALFPSIALTQSPFSVEVPEVVQPENAKTTLVIGIGNTYEHCGPIFGPVAPPSSIPGSPLVNNTIAHLSFKNGCSYFANVDALTGRVTSLTPDPATPFETVGGSKACTADNNADCEAETGNPHCGPNTINQGPLQTEAGGTCYYPKNIKFTC